MTPLAEINPLPLDGIRSFCTLDTDPEATTAFLELVPSTASVTISLAADIPMGAVQTVDIPERLRDMFRKHAPIRCLDIRVQRGWVHGNSSADIPSICSLTINGARVAVDVYCAFVTAMFAKYRDEMGLQHVSNLFISKTLYEILETAWPVLTALRELTIYVDAVDEDVPGTLEDNECKLDRICFVEDLRVRPPPHELILSVPCIRETMAIIQASIRADIPHLVLSGIPILCPTDFSDAPTVRVSLEPHMPREDYRWWWELGLLDDSTLHV